MYHAPALEALAREGALEVRALVDPDRAAAASLGARFPGAAVHAELDALLGAGLDLAIVASPPRFHATQAAALLGAGVAVLCEKPLAPTLAEGETMVAAADAAGRVLAAGMIRRFLPATEAIRHVVQARTLGAVRRISVREGGVFRWPAASPSFFARENGGVLLDIGVHVLDLLVWWLGEPETLAYADDAMGGVEANCRLELTYADGCEVDVRLSRDWAQPNRWDVECEHGRLRWEMREPTKVALRLRDASHALDAQLRALANGRDPLALGANAPGFEASFRTQIRDVLAAVRERRAPAVSGREALRSLRLIERCRATRTLMDMPWLGEGELLEARRLGEAAR
jgi:predicted dehydrogenase